MKSKKKKNRKNKLKENVESQSIKKSNRKLYSTRKNKI